MSESLKRILDVDYTNNTTPKPIVPALNDELKKVKENKNNNEEEPNNDEEKSQMNATGNKTNSNDSIYSFFVI